MTNWRNRIVAHGTQPAAQFTANPHNWRIHPSTQQDGLEAVLSEVGWVQCVIINARTGYLIDGHQRVLSALKHGDETPIPYVSVDLSDAEEALILATLDPLAGMAVTDGAQLADLLGSIQSESEQVQALLASILDKEDIDLADPPQTAPVSTPKQVTCPHCGKQFLP